MKRFVIILTLLCAYSSLAIVSISAQTISSPDGRLTMTVGNGMTYTVSFNGKEIVQRGRIGCIGCGMGI